MLPGGIDFAGNMIIITKSEARVGINKLLEGLLLKTVCFVRGDPFQKRPSYHLRTLPGIVDD